MYASEDGHKEVVKILLSAGADININIGDDVSDCHTE